MQKDLLAYSEDFLYYLSHIRSYSKTSIQTYEIALRQMREVSHFYDENSIQILDITPFRFKIVKNHKKTIVKKLSAIRSLVKYIEDQRHIPMKLIGDESIKVPQSLPKPIEEHYIQEVLTQGNPQEILLISMLYGLGLRISELSNLRLEHIKSKWVQVRGKGNKVRELPLMDILEKRIALYVQTYHPKIYLFEKNYLPMNAGQLRYLLIKPFKRAGLKITPHQLRHSFATHLLNNGARISDVSELLGHENMLSTQVYTKLANSKKMQDYMKAHPLAQ
ncbi:MAG: integrase [Epsilonproteobacteria bacterium]|nr:MAG: integrase [Campylobacterota bacterium]